MLNPVPLTWIVLLNWNRWELSASCLDSILKCQDPNCRIIVVDNASTDDSVRKLGERFPNVDFLKNSANLGFGAGNNPGIKRAIELGAEYIWLLNNDTRVDGKTLPAMLEKMRLNPRIGVVGSVLYNMETSKRVQTFGGYRLNIERCYVVPCVLEEQPDYISGASMLLRREAILESGPFDEGFFMYWEDADLCLRIKEKGWEIAVAADSMVQHAEGGSSTSMRREWYSLLSALRFSRKYSPCFAKTLINGFLLDRLLKRPVKALMNMIHAK